MASSSSTVASVASVALAGVGPPPDSQKVYKSECALSFQTPEDEGGLYLNMRTFVSVAAEFLDADCAATDFPGGVGVYLHQRWNKVTKTGVDADGNATKGELTKVAIGVEGGAPTTSVEFERHHALVLHPSGERLDLPSELPSPDLPDELNVLIMRVLQHDDASKQDEVKATKWEEEVKESAFAKELPVVASPPAISPDPSTWKCSMCDMRENLWLNLSTGVIGCGRRQLDGSGGNSHALEHFNETGKLYPLCVKLGTITAEGGDVYSYHPDEDDMVTDALLGEHLARFGIDAMKLHKTDKSMAELQLELNRNAFSNAVVEGDAVLRPAAGPGLIGLRNLGNSCYMNSVLQVLAATPEFRARYLAHADAILGSTPPPAAVDSLTAQLAKVAVAMGTDRHVSPDAAAPLAVPGPDASPEERQAAKEAADRAASLSCVSPRMLRSLAGRGHPEFSTSRQQDAEEYWRHLLGLMEREETKQRAQGGAGAAVTAARGGSLGSLFAFEQEVRLQCTASSTVRYITEGGQGVQLPIPEHKATNWAEVQAARAAKDAASDAAKAEAGGDAGSSAKTARTDAGGGDAGSSSKSSGAEPADVVPVVPFAECLAEWTADSGVEGLVSGATGSPELHTRRVRFASFPTYLTVQMRRYAVGADWQPKKIVAEVAVPETLDLSPYRAPGGLQEGEAAMPEVAGGGGGGAAAAPEPDAAIVEQLMAFGLGGENACKRAALAVSNANAEVAAGWLMEHMGDADINDPLPDPAAASGAASSSAAADEPPAEAVEMLSAMGFAPRHAKRALRETGNSVERAADWLFSRAGDLDALDAEEAAAASAAASAPAVASDWPSRDGAGRYSLFAVISHLGRSTGGGHYVAHVKKNGVWCIFNDRKVAVSEKPPLAHGYLYFFRREDAPGTLDDAPGAPRAVGDDHPVNAAAAKAEA